MNKESLEAYRAALDAFIQQFATRIHEDSWGRLREPAPAFTANSLAHEHIKTFLEAKHGLVALQMREAAESILVDALARHVLSERDYATFCSIEREVASSAGALFGYFLQSLEEDDVTITSDTEDDQ